jgi:hypothetical protein
MRDWLRSNPSAWQIAASLAAAIVVFAAFLAFGPLTPFNATAFAFAALAAVVVRQMLGGLWSELDGTYRLSMALERSTPSASSLAELVGSLWIGEVWIPVADPAPRDVARWLRWRQSTNQTGLSIHIVFASGVPTAIAFVHSQQLRPHGYDFGVRASLPQLCQELLQAYPSLEVEVLSGKKSVRFTNQAVTAMAAANRQLNDGRPRVDTEAAAVKAVLWTLVPVAET